MQYYGSALTHSHLRSHSQLDRQHTHKKMNDKILMYSIDYAMLC